MPPLLGFCRRDCLNKIGVGFEVNELLDLPVFQVLAFVSNDVSDGGRSAVQINSDRGLPSTSLDDRMDGRLREGLSRRAWRTVDGRLINYGNESSLPGDNQPANCLSHPSLASSGWLGDRK